MSAKATRGRGVRVRAGSIRTARVEAGLTLEQVAGGQVSRAAIHHIERGTNRPRLSTLAQIAAATGKPMSFFVDRPVPEHAARAGENPPAAALFDLQRALAAGNSTRAVGIARRVLESDQDSERRAAAGLLLAFATVAAEIGLRLLKAGDEAGVAAYQRQVGARPPDAVPPDL
ncbi:MAG: hypothetical protein QOK05_1530 [Chloroflexota bacterium]|nr:hypothetical protein [Chloroflexota bacterium]